jgi:hypothetical protein
MDLWIDLNLEQFREEGDGPSLAAPLLAQFRCVRDDELLWQAAGYLGEHGSRQRLGDARACGTRWAAALDPAANSPPDGSEGAPQGADNLLGEIARVGRCMAKLLFPQRLVSPASSSPVVNVAQRVGQDLRQLRPHETLAIRLCTDPRIGFIPAEFAVLPATPKGHDLPIAYRDDIALVRGTESTSWRTHSVVPDAEPLRVLHVSWPGRIDPVGRGQPAGRDDIDAEVARKLELERATNASVRHVAATSRDAVLASMEELQPHVLVFGTHGEGPDAGCPGGHLWLGEEKLTGAELAEAARALPDLQVVVLLACRSGLTTSEGPGVAKSLAAVGVPSVVAMSGRARLVNGADYLELVQHLSRGETIVRALAQAAESVRKTPMPESYHHVLYSRSPHHTLRSPTASGAIRSSRRTYEAHVAAFVSPGDLLAGTYDHRVLRVPLLLPRRVRATVTVTPGVGSTLDVVRGPGVHVDQHVWHMVEDAVAQAFRAVNDSTRGSITVALEGVQSDALLPGTARSAAVAAAAAVTKALTGTMSVEAEATSLLSDDSTGPANYWYVIDDSSGKVVCRRRWTRPPAGDTWLIASLKFRREPLLRYAMQESHAKDLLAGDPPSAEAALEALGRQFARDVGDLLASGVRRMPNLTEAVFAQHRLAAGPGLISLLTESEGDRDELARRLAVVSNDVLEVALRGSGSPGRDA